MGKLQHRKKEINFNIYLAKKKDSEIKYVIIHELLYLMEKNYNNNFRNLMYEYCSQWESYQESLNEILPEYSHK